MAGPDIPAAQRQQLLFLWLEGTALEERVLSWAFYDGTASGDSAPSADPPYPNGVAALVDGWRLMSAPEPRVRVPGAEEFGGLDYQFMFERLIPFSGWERGSESASDEMGG